MQVNGSTNAPLVSRFSPAERLLPTVQRSTRPTDEAEPENASRVKDRVEAPDEAASTPRAVATEEVEKVVELANELAQRLDIKVTFRKSERSDEFRLEVVNRQTGEVIRQVPPEELISHLRNFSGFEGLLTGYEG